LRLAASAVAVALVAIHAVVNVSADIPVFRIGVRFCVAIGALENAVVTGVGMASRADSIGVAMIGREPGVIEGRTQPTGRRVATRAGSWESCGNVVRVVRALVVEFVAAVTIRRQRCVVIVHVTIGASDGSVRAGQREGGVVVVEGRRRPC